MTGFEIRRAQYFRAQLDKRCARLLEIRGLYFDGLSLRQISSRVNLSIGPVSQILRGVAYRDAHEVLKLEPVVMRKRGPKGPRKAVLP